LDYFGNYASCEARKSFFLQSKKEICVHPSYTDYTLKLYCQPELVEGGFTNKKDSFPNSPGFDKLNLTAFIRIDLMSNWYYPAIRVLVFIFLMRLPKVGNPIKKGCQLMTAFNTFSIYFIVSVPSYRNLC
jgi:hypothetical protein